MKKKWIDAILLLLVPVCCSAQTNGYEYYSKLDTIKRAGFYRIVFTPDVNAHTKTDFSDVRIINDSGKWVPHLLHSPGYEQTATTIGLILKFERIENSDSNTDLAVYSSGDHEIMSNINLLISNTAADRFCTLSGSNDKSKWYVISDSILLQPRQEPDATENELSINFPACNYHFYKIVIYNKNKDPFNIKKVTSNRSAPFPASRLVTNPQTQIFQKDSGNISYIKVMQQQSFQFDMISLQLAGVKYYNRQVDLYVPVDSSHSFVAPGQLFHSFTVSNNSGLQFKLPVVKAPVFYLLIQNQDNLPLKAISVTTAYSEHFLTAWLERGNNYRLIMGNASASLARYDLEQPSIKADSIPAVGLGEILAIDKPVATIIKAKNNKWLIWSAIAVALLILLLFTFSMLKEMDKRKAT